MRSTKKLFSFIGCLVFSAGAVNAAPLDSQIDLVNGVPTKVVWQTEIGPSYYLYSSENLKDWQYVPTFPKPGTGGPMEHPITAGVRGFFRIIPAAPAPAGMVLIPAGQFQMGDAIGEGAAPESPVHTVHVSQFFMARHEVTVTQWEEVRLWAGQQTWQNSDYNILKNTDAFGFGPDHPIRGSGGGCGVFSLVLQWCNARSEKEGLTPCYRLNGLVYRRDQDVASGSNNVVCDWNANGYRLPTEAEWEKAARGGLTGRRFAMGNTISHATANYRSIWTSSPLAPQSPYDVSPTAGYHPLYQGTGVFPKNAPVGSFAPNGYGLHDMTGNVREWCWDWYDPRYYAISPAADPRGPATGTTRTLRGCSWLDSSVTCRLTRRDSLAGSSASGDLGFRVVRSK